MSSDILHEVATITLIVAVFCATMFISDARMSKTFLLQITSQRYLRMSAIERRGLRIGLTLFFLALAFVAFRWMF